ncbi:M4 family metallopeptidase [Actinoplanes sp. NPDC049668]|uniref:M4 family metallopeptidase n=1 Tax=unclassified Actinoplanes TaxID=2626549 RepID=UPI0033AC3138
MALAAGTVAASAMVAVAGQASAQPADPAAIAKLAGDKADALVASRPAILQATANETFHKGAVISSSGLNYVPYQRSYKGLPVQGGDFVVSTDSAGNTVATSVAQSSPIGEIATTPKLTEAAALKIAKGELKTVSSVEATNLIVSAVEGKPAALAWQSTIRGTSAEGPSRLTVDVDALTGKVLRTYEHVMDVAGTGTGWINGSVSLNTTQSGSTYSLKDPTVTNLSCQDAATNTTFSGSDNVWGNGTGTSKETGCVDGLYVAQKQTAMLSAWLGRNGANGSGGAWPVRVGLNDQNAYYDGSQIQIGKNTAGQWISSADVLGHELGHGIDDTTPGGISGQGTQEFVADTIGAATEWYANNPNDPPDYLVGEEVNLVGSGAIRNMYNPSAVGDSNCYSSSTPGGEVHAAAGPGNHWFYLLAQGTSGNGQPASSTCNNTTITGVGIQNAMKIMYNAMLLKTSSSSYLKYRTWTLTAAKNLTPGNCTNFNTVKAAWTAVSVPAQTADPTCSGTTTPPTTSPTTSPTASPTPTTSPTSGPAGCTGSNATRVTIPDAGAAVTSSITISGCTRAPSTNSSVSVNIVHTYRGDVKVDLVAPDGTVYNIKTTSSSDSADNIILTDSGDLSSETANGTWKLKAQDVYSGDTGYISSWSLTL